MRQDVGGWAGRSRGQKEIRKEACVGDVGGWPGRRSVLQLEPRVGTRKQEGGEAGDR